MVLAPWPLAVGSPIRPENAPLMAGTLGWPKLNGGCSLVISQACASSLSPLMNWTVTCAPAGTTSAGLVRPATRNVMSGPPGGTATTVNDTEVPVKVMVSDALSTLAPAGTWSPSTRVLARLTACGARPASAVPACLAMAWASAGDEKPAAARAPPPPPVTAYPQPATAAMTTAARAIRARRGVASRGGAGGAGRSRFPREERAESEERAEQSKSVILEGSRFAREEP